MSNGTNRRTKWWVGCLAILLVGVAVLPWLSREEAGGELSPYPAGRTTVGYSGVETNEHGRQVAVFTFSNAEGLRMLIRPKLSVQNDNGEWDEAQAPVTNRFLVPNRKSIRIPLEPPGNGKWRVMFSTYGAPDLLERLRGRVTRERVREGLVGAWGLPDMEGVGFASGPVIGE